MRPEKIPAGDNQEADTDYDLPGLRPILDGSAAEGRSIGAGRCRDAPSAPALADVLRSSRRVLITELREVWPAVLIVLAVAGAGAWYLYATRELEKNQ